MNTESNAVRQAIHNAKKIALFWHMLPDGDCIGAMLGLWRLLEKQNKRVKYFTPNKPSKIFNFIKWIKKIKSNFDYKQYDLLIFVDFTGIDRIGILSKANPRYFIEKPIVIFDHHLGDWLPHSIAIKDVKSISACEILFENTYKWWPELYDKDIATYFYLGITSDSWNFLFGENHIRTFTNAVKLLKLGAEKDLIVDNLFRKNSLNAIKFLQLLLNRIKQKDELLYTYYDEEELTKYDIEPEEASYGLHIIQNIDGPQIVLLIRKVWEYIKWSLRAKNSKGKKKIDCNSIANALWWWWHKLAAGFFLPSKGDFEKQIEEIVKKITTML